MTKLEAIAAMKAGRKVRHESFTEDEWITLSGMNYKFEDESICSIKEFWLYRKNSRWQDGWSII